MTTSGTEPPHESTSATEPGPFYGSGTTAVFVDPESVDYSGGDHFDDGGDELDSEFAPQPRKRLGKLTAILVALLVAGGGFLAGIQVQKHQTTPAASAASAFARRGTATGAEGGGGFGGFGGGTGGTGRGTGGTGTGGTGTGGTGTGGTGTGGTGSTTAIPVVIGQIVSVTGDTVVVKNLGGKLITVKLSATTTITQVSTVAALKAGQNVTVGGTTAADGTVTATSVGTR
jgi:hypothetical protein